MPEFEPRFQDINTTMSSRPPIIERSTVKRKADLKYRYSASRKIRSFRTSVKWYDIECLIDGDWELCCNAFFDNKVMKYSVIDYEYPELKAINSDNSEFTQLTDLLESVEEIIENNA